MTNLDDALAAAKLGVDAIGLIFFEASPRHVSLVIAADICAKLPAFVTKVGVFVNPSQKEVETILAQVPLDLLQFHGDESPEFCASFGRQYIKAIHMKKNVTIYKYIEKYHNSSGFLVDTFKTGVYGGTGEVFAWENLPGNLSQRLILAGGLTIDNVSDAIHRLQPYAVDVVSGIEASKGKKDLVKMQAFVAAVKKSDQDVYGHELVR